MPRPRLELGTSRKKSAALRLEARCLVAARLKSSLSNQSLIHKTIYLEGNAFTYIAFLNGRYRRTSNCRTHSHCCKVKQLQTETHTPVFVYLGKVRNNKQFLAEFTKASYYCRFSYVLVLIHRYPSFYMRHICLVMDLKTLVLSPCLQVLTYS